MYEIGAKVWSNGNELTVTSAPYTMHGASFQDAVDANGKTFSILTKDQAAKNVAAKKAEWKDQQDQFRRLR